jgi:hypothetical protein
MSNSPDGPRLIPGHPEFVQRPADWKKTVAKQICEISRLTAELAAARAVIEQLREGIKFIGDNAGEVVDTELGRVSCSAGWAKEQCNSLLAITAALRLTVENKGDAV